MIKGIDKKMDYVEDKYFQYIRIMFMQLRYQLIDLLIHTQTQP